MFPSYYSSKEPIAAQKVQVGKVLPIVMHMFSSTTALCTEVICKRPSTYVKFIKPN